MRRALLVALALAGCGPPRPTKQELADEWKHVAWISLRYGVWSTDHPGETCPKTLDELAASWRPRKGTRDTGTADRWNHPLRWWCGDDRPADARNSTPMAVASAGPDGRWDTDDDLVSWREPEDQR
jgi:hypothetical protein